MNIDQIVALKMSGEDDTFIFDVAHRVLAEMEKVGRYPRFHTAVMDLSACHYNGCALDLFALMHCQVGDLLHDYTGIVAHLNRETGKLEDFWPRCAVQQ